MSIRQHGYPASVGRSYMVIEDIAASIRQQLVPGLSSDAMLPGLNIFESLDRKPLFSEGTSLQVDYAVNELPADVEALTVYDLSRGKFVVALAVPTYQDLERHDPRARFSLYHELGHAVLHHNELRTLSQQPQAIASALMRRNFPAHPCYLDTEWQADAFAAAILMPADGIKHLSKLNKTLTVDMISTIFHVSYQAAKTRLAVYMRNCAN